MPDFFDCENSLIIKNQTVRFNAFMFNKNILFKNIYLLFINK
jgi:hypothetical protein